jgi:hypothetical protein
MAIASNKYKCARYRFRMCQLKMSLLRPRVRSIQKGRHMTGGTSSSWRSSGVMIFGRPNRRSCVRVVTFTAFAVVIQGANLEVDIPLWNRARDLRFVHHKPLIPFPICLLLSLSESIMSIVSEFGDVRRPSDCWHGICIAGKRGEHMSYKVPFRPNKERLERQQEKLRIAREALARVKAKYARKRHLKRPIEPRVKMGSQRPRAQ